MTKKKLWEASEKRAVEIVFVELSEGSVPSPAWLWVETDREPLEAVIEDYRKEIEEVDELSLATRELIYLEGYDPTNKNRKKKNHSLPYLWQGSGRCKRRWVISKKEDGYKYL